MPSLDTYNANAIQQLEKAFTREMLEKLADNNALRLEHFIKYADNADTLLKTIKRDVIQKMLIDKPHHLTHIFQHADTFVSLAKHQHIHQINLLGLDAEVLERVLENIERSNKLFPGEKPATLKRLIVDGQNTLPQAYKLCYGHATNKLRKERYTAWVVAASVIGAAGVSAGLGALLFPLLTTLPLATTTSTMALALGGIILLASLISTSLCSFHAHQCTTKRLNARFLSEQDKLTKILDDADPDVDNEHQNPHS